MAQTIASFDTGHNGVIHDVQLDYYGKRLATCCSDHCIRIWDVSGDSPGYLAELHGHDGPVWQISWSHPKFGSLLGSCSYDKVVIIWYEYQQNDWRIAHKYTNHNASVNSLAFSPWVSGLQLATGSSDGTCSVLTYSIDFNNKNVINNQNNQNNHLNIQNNNQNKTQNNRLNQSIDQDTNGLWTTKTFKAHSIGVNAVSWSSNIPSDNAFFHQLIVTGGSDHQVRIWGIDPSSLEWTEKYSLSGHDNWIRDVAWRPSMGANSNYIASCGEDRKVIIWTQEMDDNSIDYSINNNMTNTTTTNNDDNKFTMAQMIRFSSPVWRVSWSVTGSILSVASGSNEVTLFKESIDGIWEKVLDGKEDQRRGGGGNDGIDNTTNHNNNITNHNTSNHNTSYHNGGDYGSNNHSTNDHNSNNDSNNGSNNNSRNNGTNNNNNNGGQENNARPPIQVQ